MIQDNWFAITYTSSNTTRYFSCQNSRERDEWITRYHHHFHHYIHDHHFIIISLRRTLSPATEDRRRMENSLKMCVFEVKGLPDKKKYFCEIHVDDKIYARYILIDPEIINSFHVNLLSLGPRVRRCRECASGENTSPSRSCPRRWRRSLS